MSGLDGEKPKCTPLTVVEGLIRPHLNYDPGTETYRNIRSLPKIAATHGARVDAVMRLASNGRFTGGSSSKFYLTPNPSFEGWRTSSLAKHIGEKVAGLSVDPVAKAIEYSETKLLALEGGDGEGQPLSLGYEEDEAEEGLSHGVVITFTQKLLHGKPWLNEGATDEADLELDFAPTLGTIEGIYPVNEEVRVALQDRFRVIRDQAF
jgi:hypothetical protein